MSTHDIHTDDTLFSADEWLRYTRHVQLPHIGAKGQSILKKSRVLIVGAGGLGSPVSYYLAAAGIGNIRIADGDTVELSNLQRQILFGQEDIGASKAIRAAKRLQSLNPDIHISAVPETFRPENAEHLIAEVDMVLDCTDNFSARYLINDTCAAFNKPWLYASVHQFSGQCALFTPDTACFRCLFPDFPKNIADCNAAGVLGVLPGLLGSIQANEALKHLCGLATPSLNHLLLVDALSLEVQHIQLSKNPHCRVCHPSRPKEETLRDFYAEPSCILPTQTPQCPPSMFDQLKNTEGTQLIDVRTSTERAAFHLGGQHIALADLEHAIKRLNRKHNILCYCQTGLRSEKAVTLLSQQGFDAQSLSGGIVNYLKSR